MENCGDDVYGYVDETLSDDLSLNLLSQDFVSYLENEVFFEENIMTFEADPLLSEVQVFNLPPLESYQNQLITESLPLPKKLESKTLQSPVTILRSVDNKPDLNMNNSTGDKPDVTKLEVLMTREAKTVEFEYLPSGVNLIFKEGNGSQIFITQHMQLSKQYIQPQKVHAIQFIKEVPICKEVEITLIQVITILGAKIHLCPLHCNRAFLHVADAKQHVLRHVQIKPYKCDKPDCLWEFYTPCKLARHKETHLKSRNFVCNIENCGKGFSTIYNLNEHRKKHTKPPTLPCTVKECHMMFQNEKQLKSHFKEHDSSQAPYRCGNERCCRPFFSKVIRDNHTRICSQREIDITCKYPGCKKMFSTLYRLREHIRQHTGAKPYPCKVKNCKWRFNTASKLKRHLSTHTRDKKFHCTIGECTKSFLRSEHLKEHTLTHIEKKSAEYEGKLANKSVVKKPETVVQPEDSSKTNTDILLQRAIQSLGVQVVIDSGSFSTVNLRDLD